METAWYWGLGLRISGLKARGLGFRVYDLEFWVQALGFKVHRL